MSDEYTENLNGIKTYADEIAETEKAGRLLAQNVKLSDDAAWLLGATERCGGFEINADDWGAAAEELVAAGLITILMQFSPFRVSSSSDSKAERT